MNRKKKINSIFQMRMKKKNAKLVSKNKPKYVSKADRAAAELAEINEQSEAVTTD